MLIAVSTGEDSLDSQVDMRFGRTKGFLIYDTDKKETEYVCNIQNLEAPQGAGIQAAQNVVNKNVNVVITGHCGPKAFKVLQTYGVKIYLSKATTVKEAIDLFQDNKLEEINSPDVSSHWV